MMPIHMVFHSTHGATISGHGGNKRLAQIVNCLGAVAASTSVVRETFGGSLRHNLQAIGRGMMPSLQGPSARYRSLRALRNFGVARGLLDLETPPTSTVYVFDTMLRAYGATFRGLHAMGARVLLFPQNVDSLCTGAMDPMSSRVAPDWFDFELDVYRQADLVCCLSREDQWLLSLYGIPSRYFPYYPSPSLEAQLARLRASRDANTKDVVLVLGSASNPPTFEGMRDLLQRSAELEAAAGAREVVVVGYGTEALRDTVRGTKLRVLGGVAEDVLEGLLSRASVCVCCQTGTTGALTRIPELLCAGVPIVATYTAARSYYHLPGLHVAETLAELFELLRSEEFGAFPAPEPPTRHIQGLVHAIQGLWPDTRQR